MKLEEYINEMNTTTYAISIRTATDYINNFEQRFKDDLYPLIYVAEFVNPSLRLTLSPLERQQAISYIKTRARNLGYSIEDHRKKEEKEEIDVLN